MNQNTLEIGHAKLQPIVENGFLKSIGQVCIKGTPLRNPSNRFIPWFDTFEGEVFRQFRFEGIESSHGRTTIKTTAISDPDTIFRERRDSSGDPIFRKSSWDSAPIEASLKIDFEEVPDELIDGHTFSGFKYWFEYDHDSLGIHRFLDRQTWEIGGSVEAQKICLRNWSHAPVNVLSRDKFFSTGGLVDMQHIAFPGNLWGRWILIPSFDFLRKDDGCLISRFDTMSNIRTLIETSEGEDWLRVLDMHVFDQTTHYRSNAKTILFCPDNLSPSETANVWTRVFDSEKERAWKSLGIKPEEEVKCVLHHNAWVGFHFDTTYEYPMQVAEEFGAEYIFIDPVWENEQSIQEELEKLGGGKENMPSEYKKFMYANICQTLDWDVARIRGGEERLKALVERARARGLKVTSWIGSSMSSRVSYDTHSKYGRSGQSNPGIFATKESGSYAAPDTGYLVAAPVNYNTPYYQYMLEKIRGVAKRTGLAGFLWDSFSNLGWWHVDYASPGLEVQWHKHAEFYKTLANDGLYLMPEAIVQFSNHSNLGILGDYYFTSEEAAYGYQSSLPMTEKDQYAILKGERPVDAFFQWVAHKHISMIHFHHVPREEWNPENAGFLKKLLHLYRKHSCHMERRTILPDFKAVRWDNDEGVVLIFALEDTTIEGSWTNLFDDSHSSGTLLKNRVYKAQ
ncbi:hypothetical protein QQ056_08165 [Oscillatoria laete-virens NRMC-F 0139]|nr:hypothetical protein [Oscillatoria laete-virens NRMC-F 0139]